MKGRRLITRRKRGWFVCITCISGFLGLPRTFHPRYSCSSPSGGQCATELVVRQMADTCLPSPGQPALHLLQTHLVSRPQLLPIQPPPSCHPLTWCRRHLLCPLLLPGCLILKKLHIFSPAGATLKSLTAFLACSMM